MVFISFILIRWFIVRIFAGRYHPYQYENKDFFVSVIIPVVDEPIELFTQVLRNIAKQRPDEIIIIINGPKNKPLLKCCKKFQKERDNTSVKVIWTEIAGKRNAIEQGVLNTNPHSDICLLCDSDTIWTENTLTNLLMPFSEDEMIGGVTTRQKIHKPNRNLVTMTAALLEEIRAEGTMKAMSITGKVGCLPGRTIAFRTEILRKAMNEFMTETFLGIHKEVSDDRSLTNIVLKMGYKTVMQDSSVVYTDAPESWGKFFRQQLRWAEGSQYNNLKMTKWMYHNAKLMMFIYWSDMIMPFMLLSVYANIVLCSLLRQSGFYIHSITYTQPMWKVATLILTGAIVGFGFRNYKALIKMHPNYIFILPVTTLILSFVMAPIRLIGLSKCADSLSWGTRAIGDTGREKLICSKQ